MDELSKNKYFIIMEDGKKIAIHSWIPRSEIKAVIQISHGMIEYAERYDLFAQFLCKKGYAVYAHDHRGHGETALTKDDLGYLADRNGFNLVVSDLKEIIRHVKGINPNKRIILFGHSFGSFVTQGYIEKFGIEIDACILSGTAGPRLMLVKVARFIAFLILKSKGKKHRSSFMNWLAFGNYNSKIKNPQSKNAWLTRDTNIVKKYDSDPLCSFIPTISFFYDLFSGLAQIHASKAIKSISKDLPIFILSGTADPVGSYSKTIINLYRLYISDDIKDVSLKLYPNGRHEMLNEINRQRVMNDILSFIEEYK